MMLYHATQHELPITPGHKLAACVRALEGLCEYRRKAEELLKQRCPDEKPRLSSWFACETPGLAAIYLEGELMHARDRNRAKDSHAFFMSSKWTLAQKITLENCEEDVLRTALLF